MVERAEQEHGGSRFVRLGERSRVSDAASGKLAGRAFVASARYFDQARHGVEQSDVVSAFGQPEGVGTRSSTDIQDYRGRWWQLTKDQLPTSQLLELRGAHLEACLLGCILIIGRDRRIDGQTLISGPGGQ